MARTSLRDRLQSPRPRGREALFVPPSTVDGPPSTVTASGTNWEDGHQRVTFYCPRGLLVAVEQEMARSGRSKTQVIADALREHIGQA